MRRVFPAGRVTVARPVVRGVRPVREPDRRALTLVELLVVIGIVAVLVTLLLPAIQSSRERSRLAGCASNLRQTGQALLNHEAARGTLPSGGPVAVISGSISDGAIGYGWMVWILPYLEQDTVYQELLSWNVSGTDAYSATSTALYTATLPTYLCPSNNCPKTFGGATSKSVMRGSYVGIAGSVDLIPGYADPTLYTGTSGSDCAGGINGTVAGSGLLFPVGQVRFREIPDGLTNTMLASECGAMMNIAGASTDLRTLVGFHVGYRTPTGPIRTGPPRLSGDIRTWNMTSVRYPINQVTFAGYDCANGGLCSGCQTQNNQPLRSTHGQGVNAVFADGSVRLLTDDTSLPVLGGLCNRFDGQSLRQ